MWWLPHVVESNQSSLKGHESNKIEKFTISKGKATPLYFLPITEKWRNEETQKRVPATEEFMLKNI